MAYNEPLGLPQGSVRAILTILIVGAWIASALMKLPGTTELTALAGTAAGYYFAQRTIESSNQTPRAEPEAPVVGTQPMATEEDSGSPDDGTPDQIVPPSQHR